MKSIKLGLLLLSVVFLVACEKQEPVRYMPHNWETCELQEGVKSIYEITYSNQKKTRVVYPTRYISFDERGQLLADKRYDKNDSTIIRYVYAENGRLENVTGNLGDIKQFIPLYNEFGDLIKETYVQDGTANYFFEYTYDTLGHIVEERLCYAESEAFPTYYTYQGDKLATQISYGSSSETHYKYDKVGNCIETRIYEGELGEKRKLTAIYKYSYKFDRRGNWIEQTEKRRGKVTSVTTREIEYYDLATVLTAKKAPQQQNTLAQDGSYFARLKARIAMANYTTGTPALALTIAVILLTLIIAGIAIYFFIEEWDINDLLTTDMAVSGMEKMWMFRWGVYAYAGIILTTLIVSFVAAVLVLFVVGAVLWILMWICKILFWITIVGGVIALIFGLLGVFFDDESKGTGCLMVIVGGVIAGCSDFLGDLGETLVEWGTNALHTLNLFQWGINIFTQFWDLLLLVFFSPMALFLAFALLCILLALLLMGGEALVMRVYNVNRPCPHCGSTDTPKYIINSKTGFVHPVALHPGVYGIFHHRVFDSSDRCLWSVPTMLANGKGKLNRICSGCGETIFADAEHTFGTEVHIGIVGNRSSGKSYLLYSGLALLKQEHSSQVMQLDKDSETNIDDKFKRISALADIQTDTSQHHAVQLILKVRRQLFFQIPYHLFFYDVAGEKFNASKQLSHYQMDFYKHVQSIIFLIDPAMIDTAGMPISDNFASWVEKNGSRERFDVESIFGVLQRLLEQYRKSAKYIDFNFVCVKSDTGYFRACGYSAQPSEKEIETFISKELGLTNLILSAKNYFNKVHFHEVSVVDNDKSKLRNLFLDILKQRHISF